MSDLERLQNLYTCQPENQDQTALKAKLVEELEYKLGIRKRKCTALVEHGDINDLQGFSKR